MPDAARMRARYRRILRFAARHFVSMWWFELVLPRVGLGALAARHRPERLRSFARRFHTLAVDLGGLMIKVGQFMSSRLDVLPAEITRELEGLQDEAPPVPFPLVRAQAERELGMPIDRAYGGLDATPVAAASLGQAHRARLAPLDVHETGILDAVVKVQRPGIDDVIAVDLAALRRVAGWLDRVRAVATRVDAPALVEEFAQTSLEEVDYLLEAANAERFATIFGHDARVRVPEVVWERTTRRVLTLEDVSAIKITDLAGLRAAGIDPAEVADRFAAVMFDQFFTHGFFHADPHPGNLFVTPAADASGDAPWRLTFVDFGMMGEIPDGTRGALRRMLIAAAARDGRGLVAGMRDIGALLPTADIVELERAMAKAFARFGGMGFAELREVDAREFRDFAREFQELLRSMPFQLPEDFLLLIRAVSLTSGVCSSLNPRFNLWDAAEPYAARLVREERGRLAHAAVDETVALARLAVGLPRRFDAIATRLEEGRLAIATPRLDRRIARLERSASRIISALVFASLLIGGALVRADDPVLSTVLMIASGVPLLHAIVSGARGRMRD